MSGRPTKFGKQTPELLEHDLPMQAPWPHPGDAIDAAADGGLHLELLADKQMAGDLFRKLLADCLPSRRTYGGSRRWEAGYRRMVAVAYEFAPELFDGLKPREVAAALGMTWYAFRKQRRTVRAMMDARRPARRVSQPNSL